MQAKKLFAAIFLSIGLSVALLWPIGAHLTPPAQAADFIAGCTGAVGDTAQLISHLNSANASGTADTVILTAGCTYTLTAVNNTSDGNNGLPSITSTLTISGNGATIVRDSAAPAFRILHVGSGGSLTLDEVNIRNGLADSAFPGNRGGGVYVNDGTLNLEGGQIISNAATSDGGGVYLAGSSASFNINGGQIISNTTSQNGGGAYLAGGATILSDGVIIGNTALNASSNSGGGGLFVAATFTQTGGIIKHNIATEGGGGINVGGNSGRAFLSGGQIVTNTAQFGGGLYVAFGEATLDGGQIISNAASSSGGGVRVSQNGTLTQTSGGIDYNTSDFSGGGITVVSDSGNAILNGGQIMGNRATARGGGLYLSSGSGVILSGGKIISNSSNDLGGGVYITSDGPTFTQSTFTQTSGIIGHNHAFDRGGGIHINLGKAILSGGKIIDNSAATGTGGGLNIGGNEVLLSGVEIISNSTGADGGGLAGSLGNLTVENSKFIGNSADGKGGGVYISSGAFTQTTFTFNTAGDLGGAVYVTFGAATFSNTHILTNTATNDGGAIYQASGRTDIIDSCIVNNSDASVVRAGGNLFTATNNWWGASDGPSGAGPGSGDSVSGSVNFSNFLTAPPAGCPTITEPPLDPLLVDRFGLSFQAVQGGTDPAAQPVAISSQNGVTLTWQATNSQSWLSLSLAQSSGTTPALLEASVDIDGLGLGSYTDTITITASGALSSPRLIQVSLQVTAPPPVLAVAPESLSFEAIQGGGDPAPQSLNLSNSGSGTLQWIATSYDGWLQVSPTSGSGPATLSLSANINGLAAGAYQGYVQIFSNGGSQPVPVSLLVSAPAAPPQILSVTPNSIATDQAAATTLTITGANFDNGATVKLGNTSLNVTSRQPTQLQANGLPTASDVYDLTVTNSDDKTDMLLRAVTIYEPPEITSVIPNGGPNSRATTIRIYGSNFAYGVTAKIGSHELGGVQYNGGSYLLATVPVGLPGGTYDISVTNPNGATATKTDAYRLTGGGTDLVPTRLPLGDPYVAYANTPNALFGEVERSGTLNNTLSNVTVDIYEGEPGSGGTLLGTGTIATLANNSRIKSSTVNWQPDQTGQHTLYLVVDPADQVPETDESNNVFSRTVQVLPQPPDRTRPVINSFSVEVLQPSNLRRYTTQRQASLSTTASDSGGSGLENLLYREDVYENNQGPTAQTGEWLPYETARTHLWALAAHTGSRRLCVWASDGSGNISLGNCREINFNPPSSSTLRGQSQLYRQTVTQGEVMTITLNPDSGDADLYVYGSASSGGPSATHQVDWQWWSYNNDQQTDQISFTAPGTGEYLIEVYGYTDATYNLDFIVDSGGGNPVSSAATNPEKEAFRQQFKANPPADPLADIDPAALDLPAPPVTSGGGNPVYLPIVVK